MIIGVGTDILKIERIRNAFECDSKVFIKKTYTVNESEQANSRPDPVMYYSTRFAGKEAVFKAIGIDSDGVRLTDIEILNADNGQPKVKLSGRIHDLAVERGIVNIQISLSYDTDYAIAFAVAQD